MLRDAAAGAAAGVVATVPMSGLMLAAQKAGLVGKQPPKRITEAALDAAGVQGRTEREEDALSALAHLAFGAGAGALFGVGARALPARAPRVPAGVAFGLLVWLASYAGWVPALGVLPPPGRDRPGRPVTMVLAHVVYGAVLGALHHKGREGRARRRPPPGHGRTGAGRRRATRREVG